MGNVINDRSLVEDKKPIRNQYYPYKSGDIMYSGFIVLFLALMLSIFTVDNHCEIEDVQEVEGVVQECVWQKEEDWIGVSVEETQYRFYTSWYDGPEEGLQELYERLQMDVAAERVVRIRAVNDL